MTDKINDGDEILLRQAHPKWIQDGVPTSQVFAPTPKDDSKLSHDRSSLTSAKDSHHLYTQVNKLESDSVWGVAVSEYLSYNISCFADPIDGSNGETENKAHAFADFSSMSTSAQCKVARKIKNNAIGRGKLYPKE